MTLNPAADIYLQVRSTAGDVDEHGMAPALRIHMPDAWGPRGNQFEATVESALSEQGSGTVMSCKIYNLTRDQINQIDPGGYVQVNAGYPKFSSDKTLPIIFYGKIDSAKVYREGGETIVEMTGHNLPQTLLSIVVPVSIKGNATAGEIIQRLAEGAGLTVGILDGALFGNPDIRSNPNWPAGAEVFNNYTTKVGVSDEIAGIVNQLNTRANANLGFLASVDEPFTINIVDLSNVDGSEHVLIDLDSPFIISAGPIAGTKGSVASGQAPDGADSVSKAAGKVITEADNIGPELDLLTRVQGFTITSVLDPRVAPGMFVNYKGTFEGQGAFQVTSVRHDLTEWQTTMEGLFVAGDFYQPLLNNTSPEGST